MNNIKSKLFKWNWRYLVLFFFITLAIGVVYKLTLANYSTIKNMVVLATTKQPEAFTELYFEDHSNLPKTIVQYEYYNFTFTVHNLENKDMNYPYIVYLQSAYTMVELDSGSISLNNGESKSIKEDFGPLKSIRMKIVVELINKNQSIDFWMNTQ